MFDTMKQDTLAILAGSGHPPLHVFFVGTSRFFAERSFRCAGEAFHIYFARDIVVPTCAAREDTVGFVTAR
jgi:hypothetical protein